MTWLFTQVWLWSSAAFLVGAMATWLLFVRPLGRRLRVLRKQLAEAERSSPYAESDYRGAEPAHEDRPVPGQEYEPTARDVRPVEDHRDSEQAAGQPASPSSDRPFRTGNTDLAGYWSLRPGAPGAPVPAAPPDEPAERDWPEWDAPAGDGVREPDTPNTEVLAVGDVGESDDRHREQQPRQPGEESAPHSADRGRTAPDAVPPVAPPPAAPPPAAPPPTAPAPSELGDAGQVDDSGSVNTWFREGDAADRGEWPRRTEAPETPGVSEEVPRWPAQPAANEDDSGGGDGDSGLSGQLRSLFEPLVSPGIEQHRQETPYVPPVGAGGEQHPAQPRQGDEAPEPREEPPQEEQTPLPRRVPGASSRPGTPPANRVAAPEAGSESDAAEPDGAPPAEHAEPAPANGAPEEWYPDEVLPVRPRPDEGYTVKGHFASRQYHTSESPHFERVAAEVWFRTPADAEQAGFEPWDGRRRG